MAYENPLPRWVSLAWFIVLQGIAAVIFLKSNDTTAWWIKALGYLSAFMGFGALIELFKKKPQT